MTEKEMDYFDRAHEHGDPVLGEKQKELAELRRIQLERDLTPDEQERFLRLQQQEGETKEAA